MNLITNEGDINMKAGGKIRMEAEAGIYVKSNLFTADIGSGGWTELVEGTNTKTGTISSWFTKTLTLKGIPIDLNP